MRIRNLLFLANLKVRPYNYLSFTDRYITLFETESDVCSWNFFDIEKSKIGAYSDADFTNILISGAKDLKEYMDNYYYPNYSLKSNTEYVIVALGYDRIGNYGEQFFRPWIFQ